MTDDHKPEVNTWIVTTPNGHVFVQSGMTRAEVLAHYPGSKVEESQP